MFVCFVSFDCLHFLAAPLRECETRGVQLVAICSTGLEGYEKKNKICEATGKQSCQTNAVE